MNKLVSAACVQLREWSRQAVYTIVPIGLWLLQIKHASNTSSTK